MTDLRQRSIEIIRDAQAQSGAYPACQEFPTYRYCWFRDGAFIAHAMDVVGEHASARRFHLWAATTIIAESDVVERALKKVRAGKKLNHDDYLHTRYGIDGLPAADGEWPNFQLDGFGTWLWALGNHLAATNERNTAFDDAAELTAEYLAALWKMPCYDCWEEFPDQVHPHTLAAISAGLNAHQNMNSADHQGDIAAISAFLNEKAVVDGAFIKSIGTPNIDASLLGLATPYGVVERDDPRMKKTVGMIESDLMAGGGVHRYSADTFYGGGEWVLLTAWLAWHHRLGGDYDRANALLNWVERQADSDLLLPEQVPANLNDPAFYPDWQKRWGDIAKPLLWSHAMYLLAEPASQ